MDNWVEDQAQAPTNPLQHFDFGVRVQIPQLRKRGQSLSPRTALMAQMMRLQDARTARVQVDLITHA